MGSWWSRTANPLGHCLPALALQASLAWGLGWPVLSPPTFFAGFLAMVPDLLGGPHERRDLHTPRSHLLMGLTLGWSIPVAFLLGLVDVAMAEALVSAVVVALGSHLLIEALLGDSSLPLLRHRPLPAPWTEVLLNALSLGVLVGLVALAPG